MSSLPMLGTSEISSFKCPQQWWWKYRMGLEPKYEGSLALWFGIGVHLSLARWYRRGKARGKHPAFTFDEWAGNEIRLMKNPAHNDYNNFEENEPKYLDLHDLGIDMLENYVATWGRDPQWQVIGTETPFQVTITDNGKPIATFASTWDLVYRDLDSGKIYLGEHKTATQIALAYLELDVQAGMYMATADAMLRAKGILKDGERIAGIQYNFLRKAFKDERPQNAQGLYTNKPAKEHYIAALRSIGVRTVEQSSPRSGPVAIEKATFADLQVAAQFAQLRVLGDVSQKQPPAYFVRPDPIERSPREMAGQLQRFANTVTVMNAVRDGVIPITKVSGKDCPFCPYFDMCKLHDRGVKSWRTVMKNMYNQRDPYRDKRKSASG